MWVLGFGGKTHKRGDMSDRWLELQLADAAFPAGGLAHAGGLEAARAFGQARGRDGLAEWIGRSLDAAGELALPVCAAAWETPSDWSVLD